MTRGWADWYRGFSPNPRIIFLQLHSKRGDRYRAVYQEDNMSRPRRAQCIYNMPSPFQYFQSVQYPKFWAFPPRQPIDWVESVDLWMQASSQRQQM